MLEIKQIEMRDALYQQERELRNKILLRPIGIPDFGWEMHDPESLHFVATKNNQVVGCVVLYLNEGINTARLMQMAVDQDLQKQGIGQKLVELLLTTAREKGIKEVVCHARADAASFYSKVNFKIFGEPFLEAGVEHFHMGISLSYV